MPGDEEARGRGDWAHRFLHVHFGDRTLAVLVSAQVPVEGEVHKQHVQPHRGIRSTAGTHYYEGALKWQHF